MLDIAERERAGSLYQGVEHAITSSCTVRLLSALHTLQYCTHSGATIQNGGCIYIAGYSVGRSVNKRYNLSDITSANYPIAITIAIDEHSVREPPGPKGLPYVGSYLRLTRIIWAIIIVSLSIMDRWSRRLMGRTVYQTNDLEITSIALTESEFFTKYINDTHPLYGIENWDARRRNYAFVLLAWEGLRRDPGTSRGENLSEPLKG